MLAFSIVAGLMGACGGSRPRLAGPRATGEALLEDLHFDDFGLDEDTWLGLEGPEGPRMQPKNLTGLVVSNTSLPSGRRDPASADQAAQKYPTVLILGLFNTGTNLLRQLMLQNFPGVESGVPDSTMFGKPIGLEVWKHERPDLLVEELARRGQPDILREHAVVGVAVIRDPMSWVQSMRKAPYDLARCMRGPNWPSRNCTFPQGGRYPSSIVTKSKKAVYHTHSFPIDNVESVWNQWNEEYDNLDHMGFAPKKTVVVSYEELLLDTHGALERIATVMGHPAPNEVRQIVRPAKLHGNPNGREAAVRKLKNKTYLKIYSHEQRVGVCQRLNQSLMHIHGYHDCDDWLMVANTTVAANTTVTTNATSTTATANTTVAQADSLAPPQPKGSRPVPPQQRRPAATTAMRGSHAPKQQMRPAGTIAAPASRPALPLPRLRPPQHKLPWEHAAARQARG